MIFNMKKKKNVNNEKSLQNEIPHPDKVDHWRLPEEHKGREGSYGMRISER